MTKPAEPLTTLRLVPIGTPNLRDVPAGLRLLAEKLESGDVPAGETAVVVVVSPDGGLEVYGYGALGLTSTVVGTLQLAIALLGNTWLAEQNSEELK